MVYIPLNLNHLTANQVLVNGITTQNNWSKTMNEDLTTLKKIVQKTNTDVINQLHNLDERDLSLIHI